MTEHVRTKRCWHDFGSCFKLQGSFFFYKGSYLQYNFLDAVFPLATWNVFVHAQKSLRTKEKEKNSVVIKFTMIFFLGSGLMIRKNSPFYYDTSNHVNLWQSITVYINQLLQNCLYPWKTATFPFLCKKIQNAKSLLASRPVGTIQRKKTFVI